MSETPEVLVPLEEIRDTPLVIDVPGLRRLSFEPNPDHEGRHIEWVPEPLARELMAKYNGRFQKLVIATDVVAVEPEASVEEEGEVTVAGEESKPKKKKAKKSAKAE